MHSIFQSDLVKLRHKTLDTYVKLLLRGYAPQNYNTTSKLKLAVSLQGLGPSFKLHLSLNNTGTEVINSVDLVMQYDRDVYSFEKDTIQLGFLMPNVNMKYVVRFRNFSETGSSGVIRVVAVDKGNTTPLIICNVKVPVSELELI